MVNIEQPLAGDTSHMLREMLQNKENRFQDYEAGNTTNMMQECSETTSKPDSGIVGSDINCDNSEHSEASIDGSDEESSSLEQSRMDEAEIDESKYDMDEEKYTSDTVPEVKEAKRARLENIITSVQTPCSYTEQEIGYSLSEMRRPKRKQFFPQQHESNAKIQRTDGPFEDEFWQLSHRFSSMQNYLKHLNETAKQLNGYSSLNELHRIQQAYLANLSPRATEEIHTNNNIYKSAVPVVNENRKSSDDPFSIAEQVREKVNSNKGLNDKVTDLDEKELQLLISNLKSKIEEAVSVTVDKELNKFFQKRNNELKQDEQRRNSYPKEQQNTSSQDKRPTEPEKKPTTDHSLDHILQMPSKPPSTNGFQLPGRHSAFELPKLSSRIPEIPRPPFPHPPPLGYPPLSFYLPTNLHPPSLYSCPLVPPEQTEALSLVVNTPQKKKRTKVTDTRLSPRAARALLQENGVLDQERPISGFNPMNTQCLPTSVAIPNPSLQQSDILSYYKEQAMCRSPLDPDRNSPSSSHSPTDNYGFMKGDFFNDSENFDPSGKIISFYIISFREVLGRRAFRKKRAMTSLQPKVHFHIRGTGYTWKHVSYSWQGNKKLWLPVCFPAHRTLLKRGSTLFYLRIDSFSEGRQTILTE